MDALYSGAILPIGGNMDTTPSNPFGPVSLSRITPRRYENGRNGEKSFSVGCAAVRVAILGTPIAILSALYGRQDKQTGMLTFEPSVPKQVGMTDEARAEFVRHVKLAVKAWPEALDMAKDAYKALTAKVSDRAADELVFDPATADVPVVATPTPAADLLAAKAAETLDLAASKPGSKASSKG